MKIYHKELGNQYNCMMRGFEVDNNGTIVASWTFQKMGNGGLRNDENAAVPFIGKPIRDVSGAYLVSEEK